MTSQQTGKRPQFKEGELVWVDNPGFPNESWDGVSCIVANAAVGKCGQYVTVRPVIPVRGGPDTNTFHPETLKRETRPWLKKMLTDYLNMRDELLKSAQRVVEKYS